MSESPLPTCGSCGSDQLRRAHSHGPFQRIVSSATSLSRYACTRCGHRGWLPRHLLRWAGAPGSSPAVQAHRPSERRDRRALRALQVRVLVTAGVGTLLGLAVAWLVLRLIAANPQFPG